MSVCWNAGAAWTGEWNAGAAWKGERVCARACVRVLWTHVAGLVLNGQVSECACVRARVLCVCWASVAWKGE